MTMDTMIEMARPYLAAFRARFQLMLQYRTAALMGFATQCWWGAIRIMVFAAFYGVHAARPFFRDLVTFMTSGPVVVQVLEGENAVARNREVMGATNPANADEGTIRKLFAENIEANSVHGSDSLENAAIEIAYFFSGCEIVG